MSIFVDMDEMVDLIKHFPVASTTEYFVPILSAEQKTLKSVDEGLGATENELVTANYILQEKDRGKLITGTFDLLVIVLNSSKNKWDDSKKLEMKTNFNTIIKNMKEETKELFYKK